MRRLERGLLLKQGKSRRRPQREDNDAGQCEVQTLHADPLPLSRVRESKSLLSHAYEASKHSASSKRVNNKPSEGSSWALSGAHNTRQQARC